MEEKESYPFFDGLKKGEIITDGNDIAVFRRNATFGEDVFVADMRFDFVRILDGMECSFVSFGAIVSKSDKWRMVSLIERNSLRRTLQVFNDLSKSL